MEYRKVILTCLTVFLSICFIAEATATTYHLPLNTKIRDGLKVHFGDYWFSTSGTDATITTWFISNWTTYAVSSSGTQELYEGNKPEQVFIDTIEKAEGDGWSYAGGKTTVTGATSLVTMFWGTSTPPSTSNQTTTGYSESLSLIFKVTLNGEVLEGCEIEIVDLPYEYQEWLLTTDEEGKAEVYLVSGEYRYTARFEDLVKEETILHAEYETINIDFQRKRKFTISIGLIELLIAIVIIFLALYAISRVAKG